MLNVRANLKTAAYCPMLLRHRLLHVLKVIRLWRERQLSVDGSSVAHAPSPSRMHPMLCRQNFGCASPFVELLAAYGGV